MEGDARSAERRRTLTSGPVLYCISDPANGDPAELMSAAVASGIGFFQFRHRSLPPGLRREAALRTAEVPRHSTRFLVNGMDALVQETAADGCHLPFSRLSDARLLSDGGLWKGISVHSLEEALQASEEHPDYLLVAPVYAPRSKTADHPVLGTSGLRGICRGVEIPVIALGGIAPESFADVLRAGAVGVAGISLFANPLGLAEVVQALGEAARRG